MAPCAILAHSRHSGSTLWVKLEELPCVSFEASGAQERGPWGCTWVAWEWPLVLREEVLPAPRSVLSPAMDELLSRSPPFCSHPVFSLH